MQKWNLLWPSSLPGGGFLPADKNGRGVAVLENHYCPIYCKKGENGMTSGCVTEEILNQLPLEFSLEDGGSTIRVSC